MFFIGVATLAFVLNIAVYTWDKSKRDNLLQGKAPLEDFERYTSLKMSEARMA